MYCYKFHINQHYLKKATLDPGNPLFRSHDELQKELNQKLNPNHDSNHDIILKMDQIDIQNHDLWCNNLNSVFNEWIEREKNIHRDSAHNNDHQNIYHRFQRDHEAITLKWDEEIPSSALKLINSISACFSKDYRQSLV